MRPAASDGSAYDALVDNHIAPSIYDDGDDLHLTADSARREHFALVAESRKRQAVYGEESSA